MFGDAIDGFRPNNNYWLHHTKKTEDVGMCTFPNEAHHQASPAPFPVVVAIRTKLHFGDALMVEDYL